MTRGMTRRVALFTVAGLLVSVWAFPVLWALLTSFKTERDVLAYPPLVVFAPTLANYRDVLWGASALLLLDGRWARHLLGRWAAGQSSLLARATASP